MTEIDPKLYLYLFYLILAILALASAILFYAVNKSSKKK